MPMRHAEKIRGCPLHLSLLLAACQAPNDDFFDQPFSPAPRPSASSMSGTPDGTPNGMREETSPSEDMGQSVVGAPNGPSSSEPSATPPSAATTPGTPSEPSAPSPGDDTSEPNPPPCTSDACAACRDEQGCGDGLVCHPREATCVPACSSGAACDPNSGTPVCAGEGDNVLGVCAECEADGDCELDGDLPACGPAGICVECTTQEHCADQGSGRAKCDVTLSFCVECLTDADCDSDNPVCLDGECDEAD